VGTVEAEPGIRQEIVDELTRRGQHVVRVKKNGGGYQGILIDWEKGLLHGGSESRRDGEALGY
jgi:gamma-glutamyltranspeptidase/glutathione hydrolase